MAYINDMRRMTLPDQAHWEPTQVTRSFQVADRIMALHAKSFYAAFKGLPQAAFQGVTAVYAYCRYVDDLVDEDQAPLEGKTSRQSLDLLAEAVYALDKAQTSQALDTYRQLAWWPAFETTYQNFNMTPQGFIDQIKGQLMDVAGFQVQTLQDLVDYADKVAGSVGAMLMPLLLPLENLSENILAAGRYYGIGMQFTNILRDVGEDYRDRQRIYLPREMLEARDLTEAGLADLSFGRTKTIPQTFIDLWEELSQQGGYYYQALRPYMQLFYTKAQLPLLAAGYIYRGIEDAVRKSGYNCFTQRNYTSKLDRAQLLARAQRDLKAL